MNICIPVDEAKGLHSQVCAHFGSAPAFLIVETASGSCRAIRNDNQHHAHGMCMPLATLAGEHVDAVVVGGIGVGALNRLAAASIRVYVSEHSTVADTITAFKAGTLQLMQPGLACAQHGHGHA